MKPGFPRRLSQKALAGLVYVGIALVVVAQAAVATSSNVQWFISMRGLDVDVQSMSIQMDPQTLGYPFVNVQVLVLNPSSFNRLQLRFVSYDVFVNSTTEDFQVTGSSEIAALSTSNKEVIPPQGSLNLTRSVRIMNIVIAPLQNFLNLHPSDLRTFVGITLHLHSAYGQLSIAYCYEMPGKVFTVCPAARVSGGGGVGGA